MIRLLLLGLAIYIAARVVGGLIKPSKPPVEVRGKSKKAGFRWFTAALIKQRRKTNRRLLPPNNAMASAITGLLWPF